VRVRTLATEFPVNVSELTTVHDLMGHLRRESSVAPQFLVASARLSVLAEADHSIRVLDDELARLISYGIAHDDELCLTFIPFQTELTVARPAFFVESSIFVLSDVIFFLSYALAGRNGDFALHAQQCCFYQPSESWELKSKHIRHLVKSIRRFGFEPPEVAGIEDPSQHGPLSHQLFFGLEPRQQQIHKLELCSRSEIESAVSWSRTRHLFECHQTERGVEVEHIPDRIELERK
jgi:hypothetical protein